MKKIVLFGLLLIVSCYPNEKDLNNIDNNKRDIVMIASSVFGLYGILTSEGDLSTIFGLTTVLTSCMYFLMRVSHEKSMQVEKNKSQ
jgi:hypothetical protein